jgi:hypothetical protein
MCLRNLDINMEMYQCEKMKPIVKFYSVRI